MPVIVQTAFFTDAAFDRVKPEIDAAFIRMASHVCAGGAVYWPADGIGTGRAQLSRRAPRIWDYLERCHERLFDLDNAKARESRRSIP